VSTFKANTFSVLQKLGQSLMIPVSVLPAAGLLVALGRMLQGMKDVPVVPSVGEIFFTGGIAIFEQLPTLFAVGVAIGFSGGAAIAGLAAVAGYFTLINVLKTVGTLRGLELAINTGVFGGILIGLLSAYLYKKFHETRLPQFLGFFAGKRLVPIVTAGASVLVGLALSVLWPPIQQGINDFGVAVMGSNLGPAFYAAVKRLLIPVGLHHVFYPPFLYQFGEFISANGEILRGETARYFGGDPNAGAFMASEFAMMLFGLPAAALAMYKRARPEKKKAIGGVMLAAALTSIVTGITEPIEFAFIFVAPLLFVFHVLLAFISGYGSTLLDIHLGYTFSASAIDLVMGAFNQKNMAYLFFILGPLTALGYFSSFYFAIGWLNLKTPGREDVDPNANEEAGSSSLTNRAQGILEALGGAANLKHLDACITRLRLTVADPKLVDTQKLKNLGATGSMHAGGGNFQIVFGTESDLLKEEMKKIMASPNTFNPSNNGDLFSPINGKMIPLAEVPDELFSQGMMGQGIAIDPAEGKVYSPCDGVIGTIFKTNHAVAIAADNGAEVLVHVGIDTVKMNGEGFKGHVKNGDRVQKGQLLLEFDLDLIKSKAKSHLTPVVITNSADLKEISISKMHTVNLNSAIINIRN
jgi:glucose-specific phosphotransferase system IIA component